MRYDFTGKTVLVTGAGHGLGRAMATVILYLLFRRLAAVLSCTSPWPFITSSWVSSR